LPEGFAFGTNPPQISPSTVFIFRSADPISSTLLVDGRPLTVTGTTSTIGGDPESFIDFFFVSQ
jgi:hypothetical protein